MVLRFHSSWVVSFLWISKFKGHPFLFLLSIHQMFVFSWKWPLLITSVSIKMSQSLFTRQGPHAICATVQDRRTITLGFIRSLDSSYLSNCPGQTASGALVLRQANSERNVDPSRLQTFGGKLGRLRKTLVRNSPGIYIALDGCVILNWCLICDSFLRFRFRGFSFYVTFSLTGCQVGLMHSIKAKLS